MKRSVIILLLFFVGFLNSTDAQRSRDGDKSEMRRSERGVFRNDGRQKKCKNLKNRNGRKMKRMAAADGRISPREKKLMRRERRRVF